MATIDSFRVIPANLADWERFFRDVALELDVNSVGQDQIQDESVIEDKIADGAVTLAKLQLADANGKFLVRRSGAMAYDTLAESDIPAAIARDSEVSAAISAHEGAADPHPGYTTAAELAAALTALNLASGVYTPTLTNVANLDASTAVQCQYLRVGSVVTVSGRVSVDPTLAATSTQLGISLPIASDFGAAEDCAGTAFAPGIAGQGAAILADAANNRAQLQFISGDLTNQAMYFSFTYRVI